VSKQNHHQAKKKFKLSNNADVNDENVICSDYAKGDKVLIPESASCKYTYQILNCQVSEIGTKVTEVVSEISGDTVCNQRKLEHNVLSTTENDLIINKHTGVVDTVRNETPNLAPISSHERQVTAPRYVNIRSTVTKMYQEISNVTFL